MPKKTKLSTSNDEVQEEAKTVETKETKVPTVKVLAQWHSFSPDCRPYKPSTPLITFEPDPLIIQVNVPMTSDLILNAGVIAAAQLTNQTEPRPIFTPLGMRFIIDRFEYAMQPSQTEGEDQPSKAEDDEDWEDGSEGKAPEDESMHKPAAKKSNDEENWDEESTDSKTESEEDFEEDWGD